MRSLICASLCSATCSSNDHDQNQHWQCAHSRPRGRPQYEWHGLQHRIVSLFRDVHVLRNSLQYPSEEDPGIDVLRWCHCRLWYCHHWPRCRTVFWGPRRLQDLDRIAGGWLRPRLYLLDLDVREPSSALDGELADRSGLGIISSMSCNGGSTYSTGPRS